MTIWSIIVCYNLSHKVVCLYRYRGWIILAPVLFLSLSFFPDRPRKIFIHEGNEEIYDEQGECDVDVSGEYFPMPEYFHDGSLERSLYENMYAEDKEGRCS